MPVNNYIWTYLKILEFARDGETLEDVSEKAKRLLGRKLIQPGIEKMLKSVTVQATFLDGLKTVYKMIFKTKISQKSEIRNHFYFYLLLRSISKTRLQTITVIWIYFFTLVMFRNPIWTYLVRVKSKPNLKCPWTTVAKAQQMRNKH